MEQGVPQFETRNMYDAPGMALAQIMGGTLTTRGLWNDFFNQDALSVRERETLSQKMREQAGTNTVTSALLDAALNPWVWAAFVTSPLGGKVLSRGGKAAMQSLHAVAPEYSSWLLNKGGALLHTMGLATPQWVLGDVGSTEVFKDVGHVIDRLHMEEGAALTTDALMKRMGVTTLDWTAIRDPGKREAVRDLMAAVYVRKNGLDVAAVQPLVKGAPTVPAVFDKANVDRVLDSVGKEAWDYVDGIGTAIRQRAIRNSGVETAENLASGTFVADPTKAASIHIASKRGQLNQGFPSEVREALGGKGVVPDDLLEAAQKGPGVEGGISFEEFQKQAKATVEARMGDYYFPRNQRVAVGGPAPMKGAWADARDQRIIQRTGQAIRPAAAQEVRGSPVPDLHPEELEYLQQKFGIAKNEEAQAYFEKWKTRQDGALQAAMDGDKPTYFEVINVDKALRKHFDQTALSYAMHSAPVSDAALYAQRAHYEKLVEAGKLPEAPKGFRTFEPSVRGTGSRDIRLPFLDDEAASMAPSGRWTNADMIWSDYAMMGAAGNTYAQKMVGHHILPVLSGMRPEKAVVRAGMIAAKEAVRGFVSGFMGDALDAAGPRGSTLKDALLQWADDDVLLKDADQVSRHVTQYLSMTHQGLNPVSMITNGLQMFSGAATRYGVGNTLKAYFDSVKGMVGYIADRVQMGYHPISDVEKMALIEKHIPFAAFADEAGRPMNLITVGPNPFELIQGTASGRPMSDLNKGAYQRMVEFFMKGFEKVEWMNRSTTAGAVANRLEELGVNPATREGRAMFIRDLRRGVEEADYVPTMMNTPLAFQSNNPELGGPLGPMLSNPMMRQYLPFIYRATAGQFVAGPAFNQGIRTWGLTGITTQGRASATLHDFLRMMSTSALVYEVGKATVDADLSRGLGYNSAIGFFGTEKMGFNESPMFLPPAVDIPIQLFRGVATDDMRRIQQTIPRLIPAGVGLSRFGSIMGQQKWLPQTSGLQKTYADWDHPNEQGLIPFFKGDGTLIGYEEPRALVMKGLGADLGAFQKAGAFDRFVLQNQGEILSYRKQALSQLIGGDTGGYDATRAEFQKRFGLPLVVTQQQVAEAIHLRQVPRPERILDRLPADIRGQYLAQAQATDPSRYGLQPGALMGSTSGRRGPRPDAGITDEQLRAIAEAVGAQRPASQPFEAFSGFGR